MATDRSTRSAASSPAPSGTTLRRPPRVTEVERYSVDTIPHEDRTSRPLDLFRIQFGGANTFATVILGTPHLSATFLFHGSDRLLGSRAAYEAEWAAWQAHGFTVLSCRSSEQQVDVWGGTAVLTHRVRTEVRPADRAVVEVQHERETIVFRQEPDGRWLGVHEHLSVDPAPV